MMPGTVTRPMNIECFMLLVKSVLVKKYGQKNMDGTIKMIAKRIGKILFKFIEPALPAICFALVAHAFISIILGGIIETFVCPHDDCGMHTSTIFRWTMIYPAWAYMSLIIIAIIAFIVHWFRQCVIEVYREENGIPDYCQRGRKHRLYHTINVKCPCK